MTRIVDLCVVLKAETRFSFFSENRKQPVGGIDNKELVKPDSDL